MLLHTQNTSASANPSFLSTPESQRFVRSAWRAYTKAHPQQQTAQELMVYHFLRFGHADSCFTQVSNVNKLENCYNNDPNFTIKQEWQNLKFSILGYKKNMLNHHKNFMAHIWSSDFIDSSMTELDSAVNTWVPTGTKACTPTKPVSLSSHAVPERANP